ncbi:MAG TPA: nitroreductase family protein [Spirochaetota bacterium]|nr:nitroreductase family protein [Spirochaetota bacterium]HPU89157.1 nitroreductase family protein [Spirochaetota bacterium]
MISIINTRRSVRKFTSDTVPEGDIREILEAAMNAPSAMNEQAWQFIVLSGAVLDQFLAINRNTPKGAPIGILVCGDRRTSRDDYYVQDCSAATQNILLAVHAKGLGSVWTTVFPDARKPVAQLLQLPDHVVPFSFTPIGLPATVPNAKSRYDGGKIHYNKW